VRFPRVIALVRGRRCCASLPGGPERRGGGGPDWSGDRYWW